MPAAPKSKETVSVTLRESTNKRRERQAARLSLQTFGSIEEQHGWHEFVEIQELQVKTVRIKNMRAWTRSTSAAMLLLREAALSRKESVALSLYPWRIDLCI